MMMDEALFLADMAGEKYIVRRKANGRTAYIKVASPSTTGFSYEDVRAADWELEKCERLYIQGWSDG